ncbi:MAG: hypothetical protein D3906_05335 [Candidatus Electrothrix sp. AUS1_2]|nr:hypothetical protein [Candidatus Electrothrix sp. AUS1_2]
MIKDIEETNPKYLIYIVVPTSWLRRHHSHKEIFLWIDGYLKKDMKLVGTVELLKNEAIYHWGQDADAPLRSQFWIAIFERTT